jgi:4-amino-4-deoxy-L-arabinose transferase-like glycosyltransferase
MPSDQRAPLAPPAVRKLGPGADDVPAVDSVRPHPARSEFARPAAVLASVFAVAAIVLLAFVNLADYPKPWFDEGIHLHVPKAIVKYGVYADYSAEGFRYYGPTLSVGPTVMLPVALALQVGGIGIWQARLVMALYLLAAVIAFFVLARRVDGTRFAWVATALVVTSPGLDLVWLGRQLLGEVPGFLFLLLGLIVWLRAWELPSLPRLAAAGLLFGLAVVTKYQFLILLAPGLLLAWAADRFYYRRLSSRVHAVPLALTASCFAAWQAIGILYLGPSVASENIRLMGAAAAGAALSFSVDQVRRAAMFLLGFQLYASLLLPAVAYSIFRAPERDARSQIWTTLLCLALPGFAWYVTTSIGWPRYVFPAAALGALLVARFLAELTGGFRWPAMHGHGGSRAGAPTALVLTAWLWLFFAVAPGLAVTAHNVLRPPVNHAQAMAAYLVRQVPTTALIETWEPEMGFLTDHRYRYPPPALLIDAVAFIWGGGPVPATRYDFLQESSPDYVLEGEFARWVQLYPAAKLHDHYRLKIEIGAYRLYERRSSADGTLGASGGRIPG